MEAGRKLGGLVAVAHPDLERGGQPGEQLRCAVLDHHFGMAILAARRGEDLAAQVMDDEVEAVTDAEDRQAQRENLWVGGWRVGIVDGRRPAGEDDPQRLERLNLAERRRAGQHDREDIQLAYASCDQLRILRAKIQYDDRLGGHPLVWQGRSPVCKSYSVLKHPRCGQSLLMPGRDFGLFSSTLWQETGPSAHTPGTKTCRWGLRLRCAQDDRKDRTLQM